ncbi:hypothetical protein ABKN59_002772 [Abortiporus biennis]
MARAKRSKTKETITLDASNNEAAVATGSGRRNLRGRRGSLKVLLEMPLDILYEIFSCMHPMDLLNLTRTSKDFRALLMSKTSANLWKAARGTVEDFPDCPSFLSEPAYANLAFDGRCYNCFKPSKHIIWPFLVRYCNKCKDEMTTTYSTLLSISENIDQFTFPQSMVCFIPDKHGLIRTMHKPDVPNVIRKYKILSKDEQPPFVKERQNLVREIQAFARKGETWYKNKQNARSEELETIRKNRLQEIIKRLRQMGWADELEKLKTQNYAPLTKLASVRLSKPLTDRTWQKMQDEVVLCMNDAKMRRVRAERRITLRRRILVLKSVLDSFHAGYKAQKCGFPPLMEWIMMPRIRVILDTPNDTVVDESTFDFLKDEWSPLSISWQDEATQNLRNMVEKDVNIDDANVDPLSLAIGSCFYSPKGYSVHIFPSVLSHIDRPSFFTPEPDLPVEPTYEEFVRDILDLSGRWNPERFKVNVELAQSVVKAFGLDPSSATREDMDLLKTRISCRLCNKSDGKPVMTWRAAIEHHHSNHRTKTAEWDQVEEDEMQLAEPLEAAAAVAFEKEPYWYCRRCPTVERRYLDSFTKAEAEQHVRSHHNITEVAENDIFYYDDDTDPTARTVYLISDRSLYLFDFPWEVEKARKYGYAKVCTLKLVDPDLARMMWF